MSKKTDTDCFFTNWRSKVICDMAQTISKRDEEIAHLTADLSRYREAGEVLEQAAEVCEIERFDDLARALRELAKPQEQTP